MKLITRCAAGLLVLGAFLCGGGTQQANAAACLASTTLGALEALGAAGCTQGDKTWFGFSSTASGTILALPGTTTVDFAEVNISGIDQHTITVATNFTQGATYDLHYSIDVNAGTAVFNRVTGGVLLASPGGTATLTKVFTTNGPALGNLEACAINSVACPNPNSENIPGGITSIGVTDTLFIDTSNVTSFSNTFTERVPEPATLLLLGTGLLGIGLIRRRRQH